MYCVSYTLAVYWRQPEMDIMFNFNCFLWYSYCQTWVLNDCHHVLTNNSWCHFHPLLCMYVYVQKYVCVYICVYVQQLTSFPSSDVTYVCMYPCLYIRVYISVCVYLCVYVSDGVSSYLRMGHLVCWYFYSVFACNVDSWQATYVNMSDIRYSDGAVWGNAICFYSTCNRHCLKTSDS